MSKLPVDQLPILPDLQIYLEYCAKNKPKVTKSRGHLNRKSLYELNQQIHFKQEDAHTKSDQPTYVALTFYYYLSIYGKLLEFDYSKKTATTLKVGENYQTFTQLSSTAQYFYLLKTYWLYCNWEEILPKDHGRIFSRNMDDFIQMVATQPVGKPIIYSELSKYGIFVWGFNAHHFYWQYLGWLSNVDWEKKDGFYRFEGLTTNKLGKALLSVLVSKSPYSKWNETAAADTYAIDPFEIIFGEKEKEEEEKLFELPLPEDFLEMSEVERDSIVQALFEHMQKLVGERIDITAFIQKMKTQGEQGILT
ncbi:MAG: hypothetical protein AB8G22_27595, partial [Saprospiraceae bacterium]